MGSTSRMMYENNPPLNIDGLPIREGVKQCLHYLRYGYCDFGVDCFFHHPNPTSKPKPRPLAIGNQYQSSASSSRGGEISMPNTGQSMPNQPSYTNYQDDNFSLYNVVNGPNYLPQAPTATWMHSQWFPVQGPSCYYYMHGQTVMMMPVLNPIPNGVDDDNMMPVQNQPAPMAEEHTPDHEFICVHMVRTGNCRFGSECRFQHPNNWVIRRNECALSDKGLPLGPDKAVCKHYGSFGLCKSGPACLFDHPVQHRCSNTKEGEGSSSMTKHDDKTGVKGSWLSTCFPDYKS